MRKPRPPGLPALPLRQLERQRQLAVIAGEDQQWAIRLRMQEIELYRRLEGGLRKLVEYGTTISRESARTGVTLFSWQQVHKADLAESIGQVNR